MNTVRRFILISRPLSYIPSLAAYAAGLLTSQQPLLSTSSLVAALFVTFPMGLIIYGINDIADRESDAKNPRKGGIDGARLKASEGRSLVIAIIGTIVVFLALAALLHAVGLALAILFICLFGYTYSTKPLRLKTRPVLDSLSNGAWVVGIFLAGYWAATRGLSLPVPSVKVLASILLFGAALHAMAAVVDYAVDKAVGDTTIAVALGPQATVLLCVAAFTGCLLLLHGNGLGLDLYMSIVAVLTSIGLRHPSPRYIRGVFIATILLFPLVVITRGILS